MFQGHDFIKLITDTWILDLTEFIAYKVSFRNETLCEYIKAFRVNIDKDNNITFDKYIYVPVKILKEAKNQVEILMNNQ